MDAVEFLKERKRMCLSFGVMCTGCPLNGEYCANIHDVPVEIYKKNVEVVEKWSKDHPAKIRQNEFLKMFPSVPIEDGVLCVLPCNIDKHLHDVSVKAKCLTDCTTCRKTYWSQEVE